MAPGARAGQHHLVDLPFADLGSSRMLLSRHGLRQITSELVDTVEYRTQLRKCVEGAMGSLGKV